LVRAPGPQQLLVPPCGLGQAVAEWGGEGVPWDPFAPQPRGAVAADAVGRSVIVRGRCQSDERAGGVWYWSRAEALAMQIRKGTARLLELLGSGQSADDSVTAGATADLVANRRASLEQLVELDPQVVRGVLEESGSARLRSSGGPGLGVEDEVSGLEGAVGRIGGDGFGPGRSSINGDCGVGPVRSRTRCVLSTLCRAVSPARSRYADRRSSRWVSGRRPTTRPHCTCAGLHRCGRKQCSIGCLPQAVSQPAFTLDDHEPTRAHNRRRSPIRTLCDVRIGSATTEHK
jgi:hypothetical protein